MRGPRLKTLKPFTLNPLPLVPYSLEGECQWQSLHAYCFSAHCGFPKHSRCSLTDVCLEWTLQVVPSYICVQYIIVCTAAYVYCVVFIHILVCCTYILVCMYRSSGVIEQTGNTLARLFNCRSLNCCLWQNCFKNTEPHSLNIPPIVHSGPCVRQPPVYSSQPPLVQ